MRKELLNLHRPRLVHVLSSTRVSGAYIFLLDLAQALENYQHIWLYTNDLFGKDHRAVLTAAHLCGVEPVQFADVNQDVLSRYPASAVLLYDVQTPGIGAGITSLYYAYNTQQNVTGSTITVAATELHTLAHDVVIPPAMNTRSMRGAANWPDKPVIGIFSSGIDNTYPYALVNYFVAKAPSAGLELHISTPPAAPALLQWVAEINAKKPCITTLPIMPMAVRRYLSACNIVVYATNEGTNKAYGHLALEAMAAGVPLVCERRGYMGKVLQDNHHCLLFDTPEEAFHQVCELHKSRGQATQLAANAALWASHEDIAIHAGTLKSWLRAIGA